MVVGRGVAPLKSLNLHCVILKKCILSDMFLGPSLAVSPVNLPAPPFLGPLVGGESGDFWVGAEGWKDVAVCCEPLKKEHER